MASTRFTRHDDAKRAAVQRTERYGVPFAVYRRGPYWRCEAMGPRSAASVGREAQVYPRPSGGVR